MFKNGMRPVHPGEVLREDYLKPLGMSVNALASVVITVVAIGTLVASYMIARAERERARAIAAAQRGDG